MQAWSRNPSWQLPALTQRSCAAKNMQVQLKGCETHLKSLIVHQFEALKDCHYCFMINTTKLTYYRNPELYCIN